MSKMSEMHTNVYELQCRFEYKVYKVFELHRTSNKVFDLEQNSNK